MFYNTTAEVKNGESLEGFPTLSSPLYWQLDYPSSLSFRKHSVLWTAEISMMITVCLLPQIQPLPSSALLCALRADNEIIITQGQAFVTTTVTV